MWLWQLNMFLHFDRVPDCDGWTLDGQTFNDG